MKELDFSETNARINPQTLYKKCIDGCIFNRDSLASNYSLDDFSHNMTLLKWVNMSEEYESEKELYGDKIVKELII